MLLASWNVNSIRARHDRFLAWLAARQPDVACLQELKATEAQFPFEAVKAAGYDVAVYGQKTYNGVAILARAGMGLSDVSMGFEDGSDEGVARVIAATIAGLRVVNVYVPNGQTVGSEKWTYKLEWMERLRSYLRRRHSPSERLIVCGDWNVAPEERDVERPEQWSHSVLFHPEIRQSLQQVMGFGLLDTFRLHHQEGGFYSWWDYQALSFPKNDGLRLDLILGTKPVTAACTETSIDRQERKGKQPSDHAPVLATFAT